MPRASTAKKALPSKPKRERGAVLAQALKAVGLLVEKPRRPLDLMDELDLSRRSVERLLHAMRSAGLDLEVERVGIEAFYSLSRETVRRKLA